MGNCCTKTSQSPRPALPTTEKPTQKTTQNLKRSGGGLKQNALNKLISQEEQKIQEKKYMIDQLSQKMAILQKGDNMEGLTGKQLTKQKKNNEQQIRSLQKKISLHERGIDSNRKTIQNYQSRKQASNETNIT